MCDRPGPRVASTSKNGLKFCEKSIGAIICSLITCDAWQPHQIKGTRQTNTYIGTYLHTHTQFIDIMTTSAHRAAGLKKFY